MRFTLALILLLVYDSSRPYFDETAK